MFWFSAVAFAPSQSPTADDWLVSQDTTAQYPAQLSVQQAPAPYPQGGQLLTLSNGLVERTFYAGSDGAFCTVEYRHLLSRQTYFRAIGPEGNMTLNGTGLSIGGCAGQPAGHTEFFTPETQAAGLRAANDTLLLDQFSQSLPSADFDWRPGTRHSPSDLAWPPTGIHLAVSFRLPASAPAEVGAAASVTVHYEMYDGMPVLRKWVSVAHAGAAPAPPLVVDSLNYEMLRGVPARR